MDQKITESHLPGQYPDIALFPGQYLDIALVAGQYKIYCPALAFDLPTQSVTYNGYDPQIYLLVRYGWPSENLASVIKIWRVISIP